MSDKKKYFKFGYKFLFSILGLISLFFIFFYIAIIVTPKLLFQQEENHTDIITPPSYQDNLELNPSLPDDDINRDVHNIFKKTSSEYETEQETDHVSSKEDKILILDLYTALLLDLPCSNIIYQIKEKNININRISEISNLCQNTYPMLSLKQEFNSAAKKIQQSTYLNQESNLPLILRKIFYRLLKIKKPQSKEKDINLNLINQAEVQLSENHLQNTFDLIQKLSQPYQIHTIVIKEKIESYLENLQELTSYLCI